MKREIKVKSDKQFNQRIDMPLVADDVYSYEIVYQTPFDLTGCSFMVSAKRADGLIVQDVGTTEGNTAKIILTNSMYCIVGELSLRLTLIDSENSVLTDKELHFDVVEANGDADVTSDDRYPVLTSLIVQTNEAATNAENQGNYAQQQGDYAKQQGDYAKEQADKINDGIQEIFVGPESLAPNMENKDIWFITEDSGGELQAVAYVKRPL